MAIKRTVGMTPQQTNKATGSGRVNTNLYERGVVNRTTGTGAYTTDANPDGDDRSNVTNINKVYHLKDVYVEGRTTTTGPTTYSEGEDPTVLARHGSVYTKDASNITELFYRDDAGNVTQLTGAGTLSHSLQQAYDDGQDIIANLGPVTITDAGLVTNLAGLTEVAAAPPAVGDQGWLYTMADAISGLTEAFYQNDNGDVYQITGTNGVTWSGVQVFYVGKHGNDASDGLSPATAFLTFTAAIAAAVAEAPAAGNRFSIECYDSGMYTENLTIPSYVSVIGNGAIICGNHILADHVVISTLELQAEGIAGTIITKSAGAGLAMIRCDRMLAPMAINGMVCTSGRLDFYIGELSIVTGFGIGNTSTGELHGYVGNTYIASTGTAFAIAGAGRAEVNGNGIYDNGNGTAFHTVAASTGYISAMFNDVDCNANWNIVSATSAFYLVCSRHGAAVGGNTETGSINVMCAPETQESKTFHRIYSWLVFNGATADTLAGGRVTPTKLPKTSTDPGIQFKADERYFITGVDMVVILICGHSTLTQTLDMDLNYTQIGSGLNLNTQPGEAPLNETPVTPGVAYDHFLITFTIPGAAVVAERGFEFAISRDTAGADTGDLEIWGALAYQEP